MGVLHLVRHGQASFGAENYDVLSPTGHDQARVLGGWLAGHEASPATVVHGGLRRHRETWAGILDGARWSGAPEGRIDTDWDEFDFHAVLAHYARLTGDRLDEDVDRRAFQAYFERATGHWIGHTSSERDAGYPEPFGSFLERASRALRSAAALDGPVVVVSSGGVIAALAALLLGSGDPAAPPDPRTVGVLWERLNTVVVNTSVTRVLVGATGARLLTFNEHTHLSRDLLTYR